MADLNFLGHNLANMEQAEEELKSVFDKYGMEGMKRHYEEKLEKWKNIPLYIGITGRPGVGKSSFINALRGLKAKDVGAAAVGLIETTTTVEQYPHPKNNQLVLCDLPGVGTPTFSKDTYFTDPHIGFDKFDMFLILTCDRFYEDDLWLAEGIRDRKKDFLFIRTKIGIDMQNEIRDRESENKQNVDIMKDAYNKIRINCEENLKGLIPSHKTAQKIFLIDNHEIDNALFDMNALTRELVNNFPALKRNAFVLCLSALTPHVIEAKEKVLRERIWQVCAFSAIGGAVPIPGVSLALDVAIVLNEVLFYREQLGLDEETLRQAATYVEMPWELFKDVIKLKSLAIEFTRAGIMEYCSYLVVSEVLEKSVEFVIPIIGSIAGAALSYASTKLTLEKILDLMMEDAKRVNEYITNTYVTSV